MEKATHAFNALSHSAQADGVIERSTAIWAVEEGRALLVELDTLRAGLNEMDDLVEEYCIDMVGTGPGPTKKEERRVDAILERSRKRREAIRALSPPIGGGGVRHGSYG
jgi:hypothetical protein